MKKRPELRIIISSATLDAEKFKEFFETNKTDDKNLDIASILSVEGRQYPVDIQYLKEPCRDYVEKSVETVISIHKFEDPGDILVFLTGQVRKKTINYGVTGFKKVLKRLKHVKQSQTHAKK